MARISTGQTYGDTSRSTAAQLLGGIPVDATSGAIAQGAITAPSLQPRATPVSTFQQVGAPILGGAPKFFAPPDLPNPGQDMANLAKALGGFSTTLQSFGENYFQLEKQREAEAKQAGSLLAGRIENAVGAFTSYGDAVKGIEKKLAQNPSDAGLNQLLTELRAKDPRIEKWAESAGQDAALKGALGTARERMSDPAFKLPSGRKLSELSETDPEFLAAVQTIVPLPSNLRGDVWLANAPLYGSVISGIRSDQVKRKAGSNQDLARTAANGGITSATESLRVGTPVAAIQPQLQQSIQNAYYTMTPEAYKEFKESLPTSLAKSVVAMTGGNREAINRLYPQLQGLLVGIASGPPEPGFPNGRPLVEQLGKPVQVVLRDFTMELHKGQVEDRAAMVQETTWAAEDKADRDWKSTITPAVASDPVQLKQTLEALERQALVLFPDNPAAQGAYAAKIRSYSTSTERAYLQPAVAAEKLRIQALLANVESGVTVGSILSNPVLDDASKSLLLSQLGTATRADAQPYVQQLRAMASDFRKNAAAAQALPGNNVAGQPLYTRQEQATVNAAAAQMYAEGLDIINRNPGKDVSGALADLSKKNYGIPFKDTAGYGAAQRQPAAAPVLSPSGPAAILRGLSGGINGIGMGNDNKTLRRQAETQPLYTKRALGDELDAVLKGQSISPETKAIIRRTGMKPSEYFIKQSKAWGVTLPDSTIQKLQAIDGSKLVSSADTTGGMSTAGLGMVDPGQTSRIAQAMWTKFAPMFSNAVAPPAAAATMPAATMGQVRLGTPVVGTPKLNANAKAWLAAISAGGFEGAGYNTYYGGGAFDNTKGHPMRVVRPAGGIASSAAGRYQFMPDTWTGLHGGKNPPMTPANQDAGAYQLALKRGVDLNTAPPTIENVRKLAPVWAALPVSATGGAGFYKGQGGAGFARFRQTWNTELSRYSGR